jgi:signal transduction histidine kinase
MNTTGTAGATELGEVRDSIRQFVSVAVHDLRAALRSIRTNSELLARNADPSDETAARIRGGVERMESLIHDIAEFCYEEIRDRQVTSVDLSAAVREARGQLSDKLEKHAAQITCGDLPALRGDFFGISTVFRILLDNAIKFRGNEPPRVHVEAAKEAEEWVVSVKDNGVGFNPSYQELVFRPFERLEPKKYAGSGLGLPVARRIIVQHGGRMWADSTPGSGSIFYFRLPA